MTNAPMRSLLVKVAAASTQWALTTAPASPHWYWTVPGAAVSPTRARASMTIWECAGRKWDLILFAVARD